MTESIEKIDRNFAIQSGEGMDAVYYDPRQAPFVIYGLVPNAQGTYCRLPLELLPRVSQGIQSLSYYLAGGCIRFATDAPWLVAEWELRKVGTMAHCTPCAQSGMELFAETDSGSTQIRSLIPALENGCGCRSRQSVRVELPGGLRSYALYLPLYNGINSLRIGFPQGSRVLSGRVPAIHRPIVFYGSSITQGGCAAKPASCYSSILARRLDAVQYNLGLSGCARGETIMAEYIAGLSMQALVMDYDHNAPTADELEATHEPFFRLIRDRQPELPILLLSHPDCTGTDEDDRRHSIVERTWHHALAKGDKHVAFVSGAGMFGTQDREMCTVDGTHPTSLGFLRMADAIEPTLRRLLGLT